MAILRYVIAVFGLVFGFHAHSETIPATSVPSGTVVPPLYYYFGSSQSSTVAGACSAYVSAHFPTGSVCPPAHALDCSFKTRDIETVCQQKMAEAKCPEGTVMLGDRKCYTSKATYTCPPGGGWSLDGQSCTRPDCPEGHSRDANGSCVSPCQAKENTSAGGGWITVPRGGDPTGKSCDSGCQVSTTLDTSVDHYYTDGKTITQKYSQTFTGQPCGSESPKPPANETAKSPTEPPKKPPCEPSEGVMTSSSGTIACVPQGAPGSNAPIVTKQKTVEPFPDGSSKTTETITTRDPATGVEVKTVSVTISPGTNGQPGAAGTPGTTTGPTSNSGTTVGGDPTKPGDSDFCAKNPGLQICKGGMNEEATQKAIKDILSPTEQPNLSALETAKQEIKQNEEAHKQLFEDWGAKGQTDTNGWFAWAMIPEVPSGSCVPMTGQFMGRTIEFDWCDELEKVRAIAGYAFYILTAFALFSIFTGAFGRKS